MIFLIKKSILNIKTYSYKVIIVIFSNTIIHYFLYYSGTFFTLGCVFPPYLIITPLSYFGLIGLPFFLSQYPFFYFFIYQIIVYYIFQNRFLILLYFFYSIVCFFNIPKVNYYWDKNIHLSFDAYLYKNQYVFPEHMFFIKEPADIDFLVNFAKKKSKKIVAGIGWYERKKEKLIEKNGVIIISENGSFNIFDKRHYLRFCETGTSHFILSSYNKRPKNIFICSEFFLSPIQKINKKNIIIIASMEWTKTDITFFYKHIMHRIYDLLILK